MAGAPDFTLDIPVLSPSTLSDPLFYHLKKTRWVTRPCYQLAVATDRPACIDIVDLYSLKRAY
jgi:hypothetical protein